MAMDSFTGKLAVVTGGGSGMGRELTRQLAAQGCSVAACDLNPDTMAETVALAQAEAPPGVRVTGHACDVADEAQVLRFRDELLAEHAMRSRRSDLQQRRGRRRGELRGKRARGVGAHLRHRLVGRLLLRPRVPAAADRQRRRGAGQYQQRERVLGLAGPGHAADRLQHGQVRRAGVHRGADRGPAVERAAGPGRAGAAGTRGHQYRQEQPHRPGTARAGEPERCPGGGDFPAERAGRAGPGWRAAREADRRGPAPVPGAGERRLPGQGPGQRRPGGHHHPGRSARGDLADPDRQGRQDDRRGGPRQARGRLRLRRAVRRADRRRREQTS